MKVLLAKNIKSQIEDIPLKSVRALNNLMKEMTNNTFNSDTSRTLSLSGKEIREVRVDNLDVFYHTKGDNIFIVSINSN